VSFRGWLEALGLDRRQVWAIGRKAGLAAGSFKRRFVKRLWTADRVAVSRIYFFSCFIHACKARTRPIEFITETAVNRPWTKKAGITVGRIRESAVSYESYEDY
jgi:hypothetical protein